MSWPDDHVSHVRQQRFSHERVDILSLKFTIPRTHVMVKSAASLFVSHLSLICIVGIYVAVLHCAPCSTSFCINRKFPRTPATSSGSAPIRGKAASRETSGLHAGG